MIKQQYKCMWKKKVVLDPEAGTGGSYPNPFPLLPGHMNQFGSPICVWGWLYSKVVDGT
jgi:hypothetical protein